jgi:hypothetical protein
VHEPISIVVVPTTRYTYIYSCDVSATCKASKVLYPAADVAAVSTTRGGQTDMHFVFLHTTGEPDAEFPFLVPHSVQVYFCESRYRFECYSDYHFLRPSPDVMASARFGQLIAGSLFAGPYYPISPKPQTGVAIADTGNNIVSVYSCVGGWSSGKCSFVATIDGTVSTGRFEKLESIALENIQNGASVAIKYWVFSFKYDVVDSIQLQTSVFSCSFDESTCVESRRGRHDVTYNQFGFTSSHLALVNSVTVARTSYAPKSIKDRFVILPVLPPLPERGCLFILFLLLLLFFFFF